MKRYLIASLLALGANQAHAASYINAINAAGGSDLTFEDNSREQWVDVNKNGRIDTGDRLEGFLKFDSFNPPSQATNNNMYVTFSQTFASDFVAVNSGAGINQYSGSFSNVTLNFLEKDGGFSTDWITANLSTGVQTAISALESQGTSAFKAGISNPDDFFVFKTSVLETGVDDFVLNPGLTTGISTALPLGNFGAGLTIYDININAVFNRTISSKFSNANGNYGFGGKKYDLAIVNGNFGGIFQNPGTVQSMTSGFVDNADAVINATVPEPSMISLLGLGLLGMGFAKRKNA